MEKLIEKQVEPTAIGAEVNRIVGEVVAEKVLASMSDEKLKTLAEEYLTTYIQGDRNQQRRGPNSNEALSDLERLVRDKARARFEEILVSLMDSDEFKQRAETLARKAVAELQDKVKEDLVAAITHHLVGEMVRPMTMLDQTFRELLNKINRGY